MAYIPLNRIKTGFHTYNGEFIVKLTGQFYTGPYYKLYNGKYYSGETPNSPNTLEIIPAEERIFRATSDITTPNLITYYGMEDYGNFTQDTNPANTLDIDPAFFQALTNAKTDQLQTALPSYTPKPTEDDYEVGEFMRYFAKKQNQLYYQEISKTTFDALVSKSDRYHWALYLGFSLPWQIRGNKDQVQAANNNIVRYTERQRRITGLQEFLRHDYLRFYK